MFGLVGGAVKSLNTCLASLPRTSLVVKVADAVFEAYDQWKKANLPIILPNIVGDKSDALVRYKTHSSDIIKQFFKKKSND